MLLFFLYNQPGAFRVKPVVDGDYQSVLKLKFNYCNKKTCITEGFKTIVFVF